MLVELEKVELDTEEVEETMALMDVAEEDVAEPAEELDEAVAVPKEEVRAVVEMEGEELDPGVCNPMATPSARSISTAATATIAYRRLAFMPIHRWV